MSSNAPSLPSPGDAPERARVGVVDDDPLLRRLVRRWLTDGGFHVEEFDSASAILSAAPGSLDVVCLDLGLGDADGLDVLRHLHAAQPELPVIVMTAQQALDSVVKAMRAGAHDYVTKPLQMERVILSVRHAAEHRVLTTKVWELRRQLDESRTERKIIGGTPAVRTLLSHIQRVESSDVAVCVLGESGTGKELVARAIHDGGRRKKGPFVAINCAAIPESLQESELFGHERGAFTGATSTYRGRFEQAEGGTIFLDELGDMAASTQVKLLRALQEKTIRRVGGTTDIRVNVRVICATHRNLETEVRAGRFREDLYFRLMVYPIEVPALRDRAGDIPSLVAHFLRLFRDDVGREIGSVSPEALEVMMAYRWPGNVRELQNVVHRAMLSCSGERVELADLPPHIRAVGLPPVAIRPPEESGTTLSAAAAGAAAGSRLPTLNLRDLEQQAIAEALRQTGGHIANAARLLGMGRATLYRRLMETGGKVELTRGTGSDG